MGQVLSALTHSDERKPPWKPQQTETLAQGNEQRSCKASVGIINTSTALE